ncbi:MAG: hypothetical protein JSV88_14740 [Candidatus Aminicenantes bacterium]|nr:MAG: hypothetical protein JSV88_14740 [Candidatus Aminicenantes bacterium]
MKKMKLLFILLYCLCYSLSAIEIKQLREITLSQDKENFIKWPGSFIVTGDDMFFVFDSKSSNIKIYNDTGKLVKIFGRFGMGPDEFVKPYLSAYKEPFVLIGDFGRKTFFIYRRTSSDSLEFVRKFLHLNMAHDFHLIADNKLLVAGYKLTNSHKAYHLYEYDFNNNQYEFILPSEISYGFNSYNKFRKEYDEKLCYIGLFQYIDFSDDSIYLVWTGDIKIIKIDRKTKKYTFFGQKTENYVQPYVTPGIRKAYYERKNILIFQLQRDMSYVRDIFVFKSKKVGVVYVGPFKKNIKASVMVQIYSDKCELIKEFEVMNATASHHYELFSYFKKDKNLLYILDTETSAELDQFHKIHEFRIEE